MPSLISCPGCNYHLTLPDDVVGQRVKCPKCALGFEAHPMATPALDREVPASESAAPAPPAVSKSSTQTGYTAAGTPTRPTAPLDGSAVFCIRCGIQTASTEEACSQCGYRLRDLLDVAPLERRRPPRRPLQPTRGFLPIVGAILIPLGVVIAICGPIVSEGFRRPGSPSFVFGVLFLVVAGLAELTALLFFLTWLYQAWRAVLHGDEEYSPGLMVGLLFVPFFNFFWVFRAIVGLSAVLHVELSRLTPHRASASGWVIGLIACILAMIPPLWPIAVCMFVAWALIANNAVNRLVRLHDALAHETWTDTDEP